MVGKKSVGASEWKSLLNVISLPWTQVSFQSMRSRFTISYETFHLRKFLFFKRYPHPSCIKLDYNHHWYDVFKRSGFPHQRYRRFWREFHGSTLHCKTWRWWRGSQHSRLTSSWIICATYTMAFKTFWLTLPVKYPMAWKRSMRNC